MAQGRSGLTAGSTSTATAAVRTPLRASDVQSAEVVIVGAGLTGLCTAYYLGCMGFKEIVVLEAAEKIGAGASGRAAGLIRHSHEHALQPLIQRSLGLYTEAGIQLPPRTGVVLLGDEREVSARACQLASSFRELGVTKLTSEELSALGTAPRWHGCLLKTGWPVSPAELTNTFRDLAEELGVKVITGAEATLLWESPRHDRLYPTRTHGRVGGVNVGGHKIKARVTIVAAGADCSNVLGVTGTEQAPVYRRWGVSVGVKGLEMIGPAIMAAGIERAHGHPFADGHHATVIPVAESTRQNLGLDAVIGSTFHMTKPKLAEWIARIIALAAAYVPAVGHAQVVDEYVVVCPRPQGEGLPVTGWWAEGCLLVTALGSKGIGAAPAQAHDAALAVLTRTIDHIPIRLRLAT